MRPELHPACACFPPMSQQGLNELANDIRKNGLLHPITLMPDGRLLDGRCRWDACEIANVEPRTTTYEGDDPCGFVVSNNAQRRDLTQSQKALSVARLLNLLSRSNQHSKEEVLVSEGNLSRKELSEQTGVSRSMLRYGHSVLRDAEPHIIEMVAAGNVRLRPAAEAISRFSREIQQNWTVVDVKREGYKVLAAYPSRQKKPPAPRKTKPTPVRRIDIPYGRCQFPSAAESGAPPPGSSLAEHDAFFEKYGRVPLHPKTVKDMNDCESRTAMLVTQIVNIANPRHPDAETFFASIDQMMAWVPQRDKTNGEEKDFARMARNTMALLEKSITGALNRLTGLRMALEERNGESSQPTLTRVVMN